MCIHLWQHITLRLNSTIQNITFKLFKSNKFYKWMCLVGSLSTKFHYSHNCRNVKHLHNSCTVSVTISQKFKNRIPLILCKIHTRSKNCNICLFWNLNLYWTNNPFSLRIVSFNINKFRKKGWCIITARMDVNRISLIHVHPPVINCCHYSFYIVFTN